jgi:hypothetical protein
VNILARWFVVRGNRGRRSSGGGDTVVAAQAAAVGEVG